MKFMSAFRMPFISTPAAPAASESLLYPKSDGNWYKQNSAGVETMLAQSNDGLWQTYTPIATTGSYGTGATPTGKYARIGNTIHFEISVVLGTSFNLSGINFSLPVAATFLQNYGSDIAVRFVDTGSAAYAGSAILYTNAITVAYNTNSVGAQSGGLSAVAPFTWVSGDMILISGTYQAAAGASVSGSSLLPAPMDTWVASATSGLNLPYASGAWLDVPGATVTIPVGSTSDKFLVVGTMDVSGASAGSGLAIGELNVNGVSQDGQVISAPTGTIDRSTVHQQWVVTGLPVGNRVFKFRASNYNTGTVILNQFHTRFTVVRLTTMSIVMDAAPNPGINDINQFNAEYGSGFIGLDEDFNRTGLPTTLPGSWAYLNQGTALSYQERYGAGVVKYLYPATSGDNNRFISQSLVGAPTNWTAIAKFSFAGPWINYNTMGLAFRDSVSGKFFTFGRFVNDTAIEVGIWNSYTSISSTEVSNYAVGSLGKGAIFRVDKSGTNYTFYVSLDEGVTWVFIKTSSITTFTPNQICIGGNINNPSAGGSAQVACHWLRVR